ncbi:MBG domain-containing protein [Furfurilactobacillus entadae]|uniref:MBG domain-containing protein n=1 Tax=Furfurilactobacillus entadae TaxID=2922307 RepID=UPI0035F0EF24
MHATKLAFSLACGVTLSLMTTSINGHADGHADVQSTGSITTPVSSQSSTNLTTPDSNCVPLKTTPATSTPRPATAASSVTGTSNETDQGTQAQSKQNTPAATPTASVAQPTSEQSSTIGAPIQNADGSYTYPVTTTNGSETYLGSLGLPGKFLQIPAAIPANAIFRDPGANVGSYKLYFSDAFFEALTIANHGNIDFPTSNLWTGAYFTITPRPVTITPLSSSKYVGDPDPVLTASINQKATSAPNTGLVAGDTLAYTLVRTPGETPGTYTISVDSGRNPNYAVTTKTGLFTILANQQSISGHDFTMYVGDPTPTTASFDGTAIGKDGANQTVQVDLSTANLTIPGTYKVRLTAADGQTTLVNLIVKDRPVKPTTPTTSGTTPQNGPTGTGDQTHVDLTPETPETSPLTTSATPAFVAGHPQTNQQHHEPLKHAATLPETAATPVTNIILLGLLGLISSISILTRKRH